MYQGTEYKPEGYWGGLVGRNFDLREVGYPELSLAFNKCLYDGMADSVDRGLARWQIPQEFVRDASVLDVGAGVGFWIEYWKSLGARRITGVDLTAASVARLSEKYPEFHFEQKDAAAPIPDEWVGRFDIISAMSILHHIPVQERWEQALLNLGKMLKPGGYLLIMDPILKHTWWGKPFDAASTGRPRTVDDHAAVLARTGVALDFVLPTVALLANPVDTRGKLEYRMLELWWSLLHRVATQERLMSGIDRVLYKADRALCRRDYMPSSKLLFCRKPPAV